MDTMLLRLFQQQTLEQCTYILISADQLEQRISANSYDDVFWRELQNFVVSTANVPKLLWGQRGKFAKKRKSLRDSINVSDSSPLQPTTMRNHFEHIDDHNIANQIVGPSSMIAGLEEVELFRTFDPSTGTARFLSDAYNLREIVEEVNRIYPLLQTEAAKPHWET